VGVSKDGGQSLESLGNGLETLSVLDVLWHPRPGQVTVATIEGLYRTDDGGESWFKLPGSLTQQTVYNLLQTGDGTILAAATGGLWATSDYGLTWSRVESMPVATVLRLGRLTTPTGQNWLWAGTEADGLWLSNDAGHTWLFGGLAGRTVYNLLLDPLQPDRLVAATDRGIFEAIWPDSLAEN
jgi:ligand-binding sensor domain-containing protein